eukprot:COSAG01_NODE_42163_length_442_cov_43.787172_1_plen_74_part_01
MMPSDADAAAEHQKPLVYTDLSDGAHGLTCTEALVPHMLAAVALDSDIAQGCVAHLTQAQQLLQRIKRAGCTLP